jgi:putative hydrolase of the HAD superfamily
MKLRAVIFDFGNVLCFPPTTRQLSDAAELCGLTLPEFVEAFWRERREYDRGTDAVAYWRDIAQATGRHFDDALIAELIRREIDFWSRFDPRPFEWITELRQAGVRTGILSNLPRPLGERLRALPGFLDPFDQVTFSYELGFIKPEREIYEHALRGLGVTPEEALFIDDREENIEGARAVGLHTVLYTTWEEIGTEPLFVRLPSPHGV